MRLVLTYLFFLSSFFSISQQLTAKVSPKQLRIGERVELTYSIVTSLKDSILFRNEQGEIAARETTEGSGLTSQGINFEIVESFVENTTQKGGKKTWNGRYIITAWENGVFIIPGPTVIIDDSTFRFEDVRIECALVDAGDSTKINATSDDLLDVEERFAELPDEPFSISKFLANHWWWLLLILFALIGIVVYVRRKKRNEEEEEVETTLSLKQRTLLAVDVLENAKLWEQGKLKEHFVELSYILRSYLSARYDVNLLEKTTFEAKFFLTRKGLNEETVDSIARILSQSDMVKFAQSAPDVIAILRQSTLVKQIVAETSPLDFDNAD